jgi:16S rRNA (guanine527-N7)-methyltransferase
MTFGALLKQHSPIPLTEDQIAILNRHYDTLLRWNAVLNLTRIQDLEEAVLRHYCESLFVALHLPPGRLRVADLGSGAGFPGFPVAVVRSEIDMTLIESHQRKTVFLREVSRELKNVQVLAKRSEQVADEFDWVISRAVRLDDVIGSGLAPNYAVLVGEEGHRGIALPWGKRRYLLFHVKQSS